MFAVGKAPGSCVILPFMNKKLRIAAIQVVSENGEIERNLSNATRFVEEAAGLGAELILCPEFLAAGYMYEPVIWSAAERADGPTEQWLRALADRHDVFVGSTYLEVDGDDFWNTFTLAGPGGRVVGRVRKQSLPGFEGWYFRPCSRPKVMETQIGRLGVGICQDNQTATFLNHMFDMRPDLILMPHSAPSPDIPFGGRRVERVFDHQVSRVAVRYARALGVPTVLSNKTASSHSSTTIPIAPFMRLRWRFRGHSMVCDGEGRILSTLVDQEGVVIGDVALGKAGTEAPRRRVRGYWAFSPSAFRHASALMFVTMDFFGRLAYSVSRRRREEARSYAPPGSANR